ncbi:LPS biosynthesis protein [Slackia heliotrinireducens]|uniref:hypothetical protein n=1 Tax=Slackia heliotrinireducens TaxID=84110 RepID=UPI0001A35A19|nr:hypothetical protein [Slackia heliotrinireducens]VEH00849.1 LPS biosynthesis protein [Slackia heliotrinireducens]
MATPLQKKLLDLVREFDSECAQQHVPYALFGQTDMLARNHKEFRNSTYEFHVMMPANKVHSVLDALLKQGGDQREVESLATNPLLRWNTYRYVHAGTTLVNRDDFLHFKCRGVALEIHPVYSKGPSKIRAALSLGNHAAHLKPSVSFKFKNEKQETAYGYYRKTVQYLGEQRVANYLEGFCKKSGSLKAGRGCLETLDGAIKTVEKLDLTNTKKVSFEGLDLPVLVSYESYLKAYFGSKWKEESKKKQRPANTSAVISSATRPYKESIEAFKGIGVDFDDLDARYVKYEDLLRDVLPVSKKNTDHDYHIATLCGHRIDTYAELRGKEDELHRLIAAGNFTQAKAIMHSYLEYTDKYLKMGLGFFVSQELHDIAAAIWEHDGDKEKGAKVLSCVPPALKTRNLDETVGAFLAERSEK